MHRSALYAAGAVLAVLTVGSTAARADRDWDHGRGWHGGRSYWGPTYYAAPPVYYAPPPIYYAPPPVYYAPPPVYYAPPALGLSLNVPGLSVGVNVIAKKIMESRLLPPRAARDAIHIAVSAVHRVDLLLTWNCKHIANAAILKELAAIVAMQGHEIPVICTPEELLEVDSDD